jgi:hypothetical protein
MTGRPYGELDKVSQGSYVVIKWSVIAMVAVMAASLFIW